MDRPLVKVSSIGQILDFHVRCRLGVIQFRLDITARVHVVVDDPHADHVGHGRGNVQLEDESFKAVGRIGSIAIDGGDAKGIAFEFVFRDPADTDGRIPSAHFQTP